MSAERDELAITEEGEWIELSVLYTKKQNFASLSLSLNLTCIVVFAKERGRYPTRHGYGQGLPVIAAAPDEVRLMHWSEVGLTLAQRESSESARARLAAGGTRENAVIIEGTFASFKIEWYGAKGLESDTLDLDEMIRGGSHGASAPFKRNAIAIGELGLHHDDYHFMCSFEPRMPEVVRGMKLPFSAGPAGPLT